MDRHRAAWFPVLDGHRDGDLGRRPTATINDNYVYHSAGGNLNYRVTGTVNVNGTGDSDGTFTFAGPGGPFTFPGTDHLHSDGTWDWTVPNTPIGTVSSADGFVPVPNGGAGNFDLAIRPAAVPEPSSLALLASCVPLGLAYFWVRRMKSV